LFCESLTEDADRPRPHSVELEQFVGAVFGELRQARNADGREGTRRWGADAG
jgi:hypothetical protein